VEGPIGYGPLVKLAAWLGWTQVDGSKVSQGDVLEVIEGFLADPLAEEDEVSETEDGDREAIQKRREEVEASLMRMFGHPELPKGE